MSWSTSGNSCFIFHLMFFECRPNSFIKKHIYFYGFLIRCRICCIMFTRLTFVFIAAAFQHVRENLSDLENTANETDLVFLRGLLDSPAVQQLIQVRIQIYFPKQSFVGTFSPKYMYLSNILLILDFLRKLKARKYRTSPEIRFSTKITFSCYPWRRKYSPISINFS